MKKVILALVILLVLMAVTPVVADTWTPVVSGKVTSVKHLSDDSGALIFKLDTSSACEIMTVYATGALAAKWDSIVRVGIRLYVAWTPRDTGPCSIDAVRISR